MTNYYETLEIEQTASADEVKRAYKRLANKYHPDKPTGNADKFKEINTAYDTLGDAQKRAMYDSQSSGNPFDMFGQQHGFAFNFGDFFHPGAFRNRDLTVRCSITLHESLKGKTVDASYNLLSGKEQSVQIEIPAGVTDGVVIKVQGYGDDSVPNAPRGSLNVQIAVEPHKDFYRHRDDLVANIDITPIEAMIGCIKTIKDLDGKEHTLNVQPGVTHSTEYTINFNGFNNIHNGHKGRFVGRVQIMSKPITDMGLIKQLKDIQKLIV